MIPGDPSEIPRLRISDADRDQAASILSNALAEGRLTPQEHSERLDAVFAAKTHDEIAPIVRDLPGAASALAVAGESAKIGSVLSGASRTGVWRVPAEIRAVSVFANTDLDLREAVLSGRETRIRAFSILASIEITVPPEMRVIDNGLAVFGGRETPPDSSEPASADAPVLRITGISLFGSLTVRRKPRQGKNFKKTL